MLDKNYLFISKPRCASTSIYNTVFNWDDAVNGSKNNYHWTASDTKDFIGNEKWNEKFTFACIRNPYTLVLSWYNNHKYKPTIPDSVKDFYPDSIDEWVLERDCQTHWQKTGWSYHMYKCSPLEQRQWVYDKNNNLIVNFLISYENINEHFDYIKKKCFLNIELVHANCSNNKQDLSSDVRNRIYQLFEPDFSTFGY